MSDATALVDSKVSASGEATSLAIEKFNGQVKVAYTNIMNLMGYFDLQSVTGTNVVSNKYLGITQVQALAPGVDVKGTEVEFDKNSLVIDTTVISRNIVGVLADVQDDIMTKGKLAVQQVNALKQLENRMLLQQGIYGAISNTATKRTKPRVAGHGFSTIHSMAYVGAEYDPNKLMAAIEWTLEDMLVQDIPLAGMTIFMPWKYFNALRDAERICDARYNISQDTTVTGFVLKSYNIPVVPTNDFPKKSRDHKDADGVVADHHLLSKASNGYRYDVATATDYENQEKVAALIVGREGLLVGRSIDITGEVWWNQGNKSWYIDTYMAEGAIPDRWEHLGAVVMGTSDEAGLAERADRKAIVTKSAPTQMLTADAIAAAVTAAIAASAP